MDEIGYGCDSNYIFTCLCKFWMKEDFESRINKAKWRNKKDGMEIVGE